MGDDLGPAITHAIRPPLPLPIHGKGAPTFNIDAPIPYSVSSGEGTVNRYITVGVAMVASAALGAAAVQTIYAQTKPPAYNIAEITIKDQDGYNKEYLPPITMALTDAAGKFLVRGGKTISYEGAAPAPRVDASQQRATKGCRSWSTLSSPTSRNSCGSADCVMRETGASWRRFTAR